MVLIGQAFGPVRSETAGRAATACAVVLFFLVTAWDAGAATWSIQQIPPPAAPSGQIKALSCTSWQACIAVGSYVDSTGRTVGLAEPTAMHAAADGQDT